METYYNSDSSLQLDLNEFWLPWLFQLIKKELISTTYWKLYNRLFANPPRILPKNSETLKWLNFMNLLIIIIVYIKYSYTNNNERFECYFNFYFVLRFTTFFINPRASDINLRQLLKLTKTTNRTVIITALSVAFVNLNRK